MKRIILLAETGSDINKELAAQYDIEIVPMHVNFDDETLDDGEFPVEKIPEYYKSTGKLPKTSGCTPGDFEVVFDRIHKEEPEAHILYLAYSAVTTCSYQSAVIASEDRDYVTFIDTKQVSGGQGAIVMTLAEKLKENPEMTIEEAVEEAHKLIARAKMCFMPDNLEFLHAGGRVSNAAYLGARILNIHPCIELLDGKLVATKKYRGKMTKVAEKFIREYVELYNLDRECLWVLHVTGLSDEVRASIESTIAEFGFKKVVWMKTGGVITTHGGPAAFGFAGFEKSK